MAVRLIDLVYIIVQDSLLIDVYSGALGVLDAIVAPSASNFTVPIPADSRNSHGLSPQFKFQEMPRRPKGRGERPENEFWASSW